MSNKITYRKQFTRCGKQRCRKCREGEGHGPYWYAYWSENGRTVSKYIGTQLPDSAEAAQTGHVEQEQPPLDTTSTQDISGPILRVYLLGQFRVERRTGNEWKTIDSRIWRRRRARALLGCLLTSNGRRLGREPVIEQLWPDLDIDVAANRLNGAVHELRQILEPELARPAASRMLRLERDMLELADSSSIWVDAEAFESLLKAANATTDTAQTEQILEEATRLYGGNYLLEELYSEWTIQRRDALQRSWIGLLLKLADVRAERSAYVDAIETLDRIRAADPTNETALQRLMILLTRLDRRGEALQVYRQHVTMLQRDYESEPLPETRALYETLRQGLPLDNYMSKTQSAPRQETSPPTVVSPTTRTAIAPAQALSLPRPPFQLSRHNQSPLVGRDHERNTLRQAILSIEEIVGKANTTQKERPRTGHTTPAKRPHFLLLQGEPGIGKTRLAEETSQEAYARGWTVAWSRAYEQEGTVPYRLWTDLLRVLLQDILPLVENDSLTRHHTLPQSLQARLERLRPLLPELSHQPSPLPPRFSAASHSHDQDRLHLWEATHGLLTMLSNAYPVLLVLDDIHWADESSIELLTYLAHHLRNQRILLIATCRDEELPAHHKLRTLISDLRREQAIITLSVQPLTHDQIETLISHLPQEVVQSIQTQASGNPFFAEELARFVGNSDHDSDITHARDQQYHQQTEPVARDGMSEPLRLPPPRASSLTPFFGRTDTRKQRSVPEAIAAVLERRLGRLSVECQTLLAKAAVLGGSFELEQLLAMTSEHSEDKTLDLLEEALFAGLLTEEGTGAHISYHFWHPLIVSHLYERLSAARRAQLHRRAAEAIKHIHASSQLEKVAAAIIYHLNKGGGDLASIAHYAELAGNNAYTLSAYAEAQHYYLQAYQALTGMPLEAHNSAYGNDIHATIQHITNSNAIQHFSIGTQLLPLCRLLEHIAECFVVQGNFEDARRLYEYILTIRTSPRFQSTYALHREVQIQALLWREISTIWVATGEYANAYACYERGKNIMSTAGVVTGAAWACLHLQYGAMLRLDGNYQAARRYLQEALTTLEQEVPQVVYYSPDNDIQKAKSEQEALALSVTGPSSTPMSKELLTRTERALTGNVLEVGYAHEQLGIVDASVGQLSDGLRHMHIARVIYEQHELFTDTARICGNLGAAYIMRGELSAARTYLHRSYDLAERIGDLPNMTFITCNLGDVASRSGDLLESESWFKRGITFAEQINDREHISWSSVELAAVQQDLGYLKEAVVNIGRAISIGRAIKSKRCIRYALIGLGELRITEAIITCKLYPGAQRRNSREQTHDYQRLLNRAKSTLQRAIALEGEGLEVEPAINGKLLLATAYFLQDEIETAHQLTLQTMAEAQEHETSRVVGRAQRLLGRVLCAQGHYIEADYYFDQAIHMFHECELRLEYARTLHIYGATLLQRALTPDKHSSHVVQQEERESDYKRGLSYLREAHNIFAACHATIDLSWVEQILMNEGEISNGRLEHRRNGSTATNRETAADRTSH